MGDLSSAVSVLLMAETRGADPAALAPERSALLAALATERERATSQSQWNLALETIGSELSLAPGDMARHITRADLLHRAGRDDQATKEASALAALPGATASDCLALARLLKATGAPDATIAAALDAAARLTPNGASDPAIAHARRELFPPPRPHPSRPLPRAAGQPRLHAPRARRQRVDLPPLIPIPAGQFRLGSDKARDKDARDDELKRLVVDLPAFQIARFPVTVAEYACFRRATSHAAPPGTYNALTWDDQLQQLDHPVVTITWYDAYDYAAWLAERTGQPWRLPTEAEWEKAARLDPRDPLGASSERVYPWGDTFDQSRCNTSESSLKGTSPVGWYGPDNPDPRAGRQSGASPCGVEEMAGNVWEWTASIYAADYTQTAQQAARNSTGSRSLRGGSWDDDPVIARAAYRDGYDPGLVATASGFVSCVRPLAHNLYSCHTGFLNPFNDDHVASTGASNRSKRRFQKSAGGVVNWGSE